ncbi:tyrosine-type recombinase/integrase [Billgrantia ethanolica]|uniref:Site-specific integrase n=1 Tax=Billgrantia ethanolica TaxID=2733486 RepID=A0ABS9ABR7_9GAMM|nr:site-specific integrase [Halomonas ethanolica]MCE8005274.1 site-specific integrase [Halomonas ethanolica]
MRDLTFPEVMQEMFTERWLSPKTQTSYAGPIALFRRHIGMEVLPSEVSRKDVLMWRSAIVTSPRNPSGIEESSWNNYARHLKAFYRFGISHELIPIVSSPFENVFLREKKRGHKTLRETDIVYAREALEICRRYEVVRCEPAPLHPAWFWQVVVETFYHTGIRLNQLLNMTPNDIHLKRRRLIASAEGAKNKSEAVLPITEDLYPYLAKLMTAAHAAGFKRHDQLFNVNRFSLRHRRETMNVWQVEGFFNRLSRYCGNRVTPHRFRHSLATDLMRSPGRDIFLTQQVCGHTDIRSTIGYVAPDLATLRRYLEQRHAASHLDDANGMPDRGSPRQGLPAPVGRSN